MLRPAKCIHAKICQNTFLGTNWRNYCNKDSAFPGTLKVVIGCIYLNYLANIEIYLTSTLTGDIYMGLLSKFLKGIFISKGIKIFFTLWSDIMENLCIDTDKERLEKNEQ